MTSGVDSPSGPVRSSLPVRLWYGSTLRVCSSSLPPRWPVAPGLPPMKELPELAALVDVPVPKDVPDKPETRLMGETVVPGVPERLPMPLMPEIPEVVCPVLVDAAMVDVLGEPEVLEPSNRPAALVDASCATDCACSMIGSPMFCMT